MCLDDNPQPFRDLGLSRYPALAAGDETLTAVFLTKRKIRGFLKRL